MATGTNKLKLLYLMRILMDKTDKNHSMTMREILDELSALGIEAERKSLYSDIEYLRSYGLDIKGTKDNRTYYYQVISRDFEPEDLKLIIDAVSSLKDISKKKTSDLIKKLAALASVYDAKNLLQGTPLSKAEKSEKIAKITKIAKEVKEVKEAKAVKPAKTEKSVNKKEEIKKDEEKPRNIDDFLL